MSSKLPSNDTACEVAGRGPLLKAVDVSRTYDDGSVHALANVSLTIHRGEYLAIMGPSGSGKSTLLNLLGALDEPTSGEILFDDQPLGGLADIDQFRASMLGFVFQSFYLLPTLTALENVQIPMFESLLGPRERAQKASELLSLVGMSHRSRHLPTKLSVGERQRVAVARALANDPKLLLADEPTGNLDSPSGKVVLDLFDRLHRERGLTLVVITHDSQVAARAERTIWIRDGRIQES
jgi:putative ABC transport system ATP-binding protein